MSENSSFTIKGRFDFELIRDGEVIDTWSENNTVMGEGKDHILGVVMRQDTQITQWYVGLKIGSATVAGTWTAATDITGANINENDGTYWDETSREVWNDGDAVSGSGAGPYSVTNDTTPASYTVATGQTPTVYGAFIAAGSAFQNTTAPLLAVADFSGGSRSLIAADVLNVKYTLTIS